MGNTYELYPDDVEIWKPIIGYEDKYEISTFGRVRNKHGKILAQCNKGSTDYKRVHLARDNKAKWFSVHRLVAIAFLPKVDGKDTVNHLDHNKSNNHVNNLEWATLKENCEYASQEGRYKVPYKNLKKGLGLLKKSVICTSNDGTEYVFESITQAGKVLGIDRKYISRCCNNHYGRNTTFGYSCRFA